VAEHHKNAIYVNPPAAVRPEISRSAEKFHFHPHFACRARISYKEFAAFSFTGGGFIALSAAQVPGDEFTAALTPRAVGAGAKN
jgi:hypothetical protein